MLALAPRRGASYSVNMFLRHPSPRPSVVVDPAAFGVVDPAVAALGRPGPFGRERVVFALPLDPGPALLSPSTVLHDGGPALVADPSGAIVGVAAVWVSRMLSARWVEDTRRF